MNIIEKSGGLAQLRGSLDLLLRALRHAKSGYIVSDVVNGRVYFSDSLFELRKTPRRPFLTREEGMAFIHPDDRERFLKARARAAEDGREFELEMRILCGDGSINWERSNSQPHFDDAGNFIGLLSVIEDISESKSADATLKAQEATYRALFNSIGDAIFLTLDGVFVECNEAALTMFGATREQLNGSTPVAFSPDFQPDGTRSLDKARAMIAAALAGDKQAFEWRHKRFDESEFDAEVVLTRVEGASERYFFGVVRDITERKQAEAALKASHAKFEGAFKSATDAMIVAQVGDQPGTGRIVDINDAAIRMLGRRHRDELIGKTVAELRVRTEASDIAVLRDKLLNNEIFRDFPTSLRKADDTLIETLINGATFYRGTERLGLLTVRDVTEARAAERRIHELNDSLQASVHQLRAIADNLPAAISQTDADGRFTFVNRAMEQWFARPATEMLGRTIEEMVSPGYMEAIAPARQGRAAGDYRHEVTLSYPDGVSRTVDLTSLPDRGPDGDHRGFFTLALDITGRKAAETALKASHDTIRELNISLEDSLRLIRAIADNLPVAISYQDADGVFRFTNRTLENWFASAPGAMLGTRVADLVSRPYLDAIEPMRAKVGTTDDRIEGTVPYPDGVTRTIEATIVQDRNPDGSIRGRYTLLIDLSERKAAEQQLQQSQKMQAIGKLTGGVAHDFNNLLGVITGNLEMANEALGPGEEKIARLLEPARRAAERGTTLTRSLLSFARQQALSPQVVDLNVLARDMTELLRRTMPSNIAIEYVGGAGLWSCEVDPGQLQNALLNLVVNSRDAMPNGGRLTIETRNTRVDAEYAFARDDLAPGQYVMLAVSDTGSGMPADVIARAFEPFYTTKGLGQGTGLGLSMVYGFAKQSGGHVAIYSEVGSGTSVKLYLPRHAGQAEAEPQPGLRPAPAAQDETVLVVEDDDDMRFVAVTMLRSLGYSVLEAASGPKALDTLAGNGEIALLVTDVVLAGSMNGRRLAQEAQARKAGLGVLFMSGYTEDAILHHGRLDPGVHFIQKPFRRQDLAAKVREALDALHRQ